MYKILIQYNKEHHLWQQYGITTSTKCVSGESDTFTEFATDDIEEVKKEVLKLDRIYGNENVKVYKDLTATYHVDIDLGDDMDSDESGVEEDSIEEDSSNESSDENIVR